MKKYKLFLILFSVPLFVLISCGEDFLGLTPHSSTVIEELYKTESDFDQAVLGTYSALRGQYGNAAWHVGDLRADDVWQEMLNQTGHVLTDTYSGHTAANDIWNNGYATIHRANMILQQIENIDIPNKARYIAETKFLRALTYFNIVRVFGDAPLLTEPVLPDEASLIGRTAINLIYDDLIIPDFIEATNGLPEQYSGESIGRATSGAATALLGKVYLTRGDFLKAESTLLQVTNMGYELLEDYNAIFDWINGKHHSEYIFEIEYSSSPGIQGSDFTQTFSPNWDIFRAHYNIGGTLHDSFTPTMELFNLFEDEDLRKDISVTNGITTNEGEFIEIPSRLMSLMCLKYAIPVDFNNNGDANWIVIRYADVLLMLAEAMNENGKVDEGLNYLNEVRERAGLNPLFGLSQTEMRDAIELERRLEFIGEGHRWFDLIRWGKAEEILGPLGMEPYMVLWPIPQTEIDLINDPSILPQNPGYGVVQ